MKDVIEVNKAELCGKIVSECVISHEMYGEKFYNVDIEVPRLSNTMDVIPLMISDRLIDISTLTIDTYVKVSGNFRSYNKHENDKNRLILSVFVREIAYSDSDEASQNINNIELDGYVCKKPINRTTPLGREITDVLIAVNRPYGKSDYIPCIIWGRNARYTATLNVGDRVQIFGRVQSREYTKKISEDSCEKRVAYEISVSKVVYVDPEEDNDDLNEDTATV